MPRSDRKCNHNTSGLARADTNRDAAEYEHSWTAANAPVAQITGDATPDFAGTFSQRLKPRPNHSLISRQTCGPDSVLGRLAATPNASRAHSWELCANSIYLADRQADVVDP
jgi:hypothetical protein